MTSCDVLIVGGGPAGSSCAWRLSRAGRHVVVWDRQQFPRDKICAGWITPQILVELELDAQVYAASGRTFQPINGFRLSRLGDPDVCVRYDHTVSYAIRRCEFDDYLLRRAGADLRLGVPVRSLRRDGDDWVLNDTIRTKMLIGAGGHFCAVAQHLGACLGASEPIVAAQEVEFELTPEQRQQSPVEPDAPELFFTRDLKGYGWVVRKGNYINIGLGRQDTKRLGEHVEAFLASMRQQGKIPAACPRKLRGHPYLLYDQARRPLVGDGVLLVGDAAGLAYPKSGEGIRPAIESGLLAAQTILETEAPYDADHLAVYERRVVARFGPRRAGWGITDIVPASIAGKIAGRLFGAGWFARHVVLDRWFFHVDVPPLHTDAGVPLDRASEPLGSRSASRRVA